VHFLGPSLSYALLRNDQAVMRLFMPPPEGWVSELGVKGKGAHAAALQVLSLLALPVQKYKRGLGVRAWSQGAHAAALQVLSVLALPVQKYKY
jgi:hypothetical protein